ncbi:MAG: Xaa-Pro dipeptidase [Chloroflexi bacterium]|nr:MAG: Xaa-Pro dipeptidase [Chloroflexota bacterium]
MRLEKLREAIAAEGLDGLLVTQPENRRYLSGFTGSAGVLLITPDFALIATDFRYFEQVGRECPQFELVKIEGKFTEVLPEMLADAGVKRLGFESEHLTVAQYEEWQRAAKGVEWVPTRGLVEKIRMVKTPEEVEAIRKAVALADEAFAHICECIHPGMTEKEAAWELEVYMRTHGAQKLAFDIIVASGPNGAMPHAKATDKPIEEGEPIVMDLGCVVNGYCSDLTRTIVLGSPDERFREIYEIVLRAQEEAERRIKAGISGREADAIARQVIDEAGYGDKFGHNLGHGVGLAVHEKPAVGRLSEDTLEAGCIITVEPGIYIPGWGGIRIEDMVLVKEEGTEVLTQAPKRWEI